MTVSRWIAYQWDYFLEEWVGIEDAGVAPDIYIAPEDSFDGEHDYVLEEALAQLASS